MRGLLIAAGVLLAGLLAWVVMDGTPGGSAARELTSQERGDAIRARARDAIARARCQRLVGERGAGVSQLTLELDVTRDGRARAASMEAERPPGSEDEVPPEVSECVARAAEGVRYPAGVALRVRVPVM